MKRERNMYFRLALLAAASVLPLLGQGDRGVITGTVNGRQRRCRARLPR